MAVTVRAMYIHTQYTLASSKHQINTCEARTSVTCVIITVYIEHVVGGWRAIRLSLRTYIQGF